MKRNLIIILIVGILILFTAAYFLFIKDKVMSGELTDKQVKAELERLREVNQNLNYDDLNWSEPGVDFGIYNGQVLYRTFYCSDVCPNYGGYLLIYKGINSEEECDEIGGESKYDPAWGGYKGCFPIV